MTASAVSHRVTTVADALTGASQRIAAVSDSPGLDAELLLAQILKLRRGQLLIRGADALSASSAQAFEALVARRCQGEPVAYLRGSKGFWTLDLEVTPAVLVPRPETELLVEWALQCVHGVARPALVDLGTGSGAIALSLASERGDAQILATDRSASALVVAQANASRLSLSVEFQRGDWYAACAGRRFELVVSNPPYVAGDDRHLDALRAEPREALTPEGDGLSALRAIIAGAPGHLKAGGRLLVEHGADQGAAVRALFEAAGFTAIETRRDLAGLERASGGIRA